MTRSSFKKGQQRDFLEAIKERSNLTWKELSEFVGVSPRTLSDWRREKYNADSQVIDLLANEYNIEIPERKLLSKHWYVNKGALKGGQTRIAKHGNPGTSSGRQKGGEVSQQRRRENPEYYRNLGCNVRKEFKVPRKSSNLAELVGIILGDGHIGDSQVRITLHRDDDRVFAQHTSLLFDSIIGEEPTWNERNRVIELTLTGVALVELLESLGLQRGNKVENQVQVPSWINQRECFQKACMRGLFDTDGCIYTHNKPEGVYLGWTYTSHSEPLLEWTYSLLASLGLRCKVGHGRSLYIYNRRDIAKYLKIVGSSNPRKYRKGRKYLEECAEW